MDKPKVKRRKKICTRCGRKLWLREFYKSANGWIGSVCKECTCKQRHEEYNRKNKVKDGIFLRKSKGRIIEHKGLATRIFWSPSMLSYLQRHFPNTKNEELAGAIGVSVRTMVRKARELNLKKDDEWLADVNNENRVLANAESKRKGYPAAFKPGCTVGKDYWFKKKYGIIKGVT